MQKATITAIGAHVPERIADNKYFESIIETNDEWIRSRTGIQERRIAREDEFTSDLCVGAARDLAATYHKDLEDVDFILVATVSPDQPMPSVACQIQYKLGLKHAGALDLAAACAGFAYGLVVAQGLIAAGTHKKILVFGAETLSKITDYEDRTSCVLFGDGAGVVLVEPGEGDGFMGCVTGAEGSGGQDLYLTSQNTTINGETVIANNKIHQNGRRVFKWAVTTMPVYIRDIAKRSGWSLDQVDWLVPHSANMRILEAISDNLDFPLDKFLESIVWFGNTSSATIPLALHQGVKAGKLKKGDKVILMGFGGGLAYAGLALRWAF
ncbi:MAG: ketoacyl-ACP synthase III [Lewinellaceae bacterium]|nr:ketoacyl-ACP synthase III [Lewinellaceae bacterium]